MENTWSKQALLCQKYSFNMQEDSQLVEKAVQSVLLKGLRTPDIKQGA